MQQNDRTLADSAQALLKKSCSALARKACLAPDETVVLLHPPLPLVGVLTVMERERQQKWRADKGAGHAPHQPQVSHTPTPKSTDKP